MTIVLAAPVLLVIYFSIWLVVARSVLAVNGSAFLGQHGTALYAGFLILLTATLVIFGNLHLGADLFGSPMPIRLIPWDSWTTGNTDLWLGMGIGEWMLATATVVALPVGWCQFQCELAVLTAAARRRGQSVKISRPTHISTWLFICTLASVVLEEMIWRAYLPSGLYQEWALAPVWAASIAMMSFGFQHFIFGVYQIPIKIVHGSVWFILADLSQSLWPAILAHAAFNGALMLHGRSENEVTYPRDTPNPPGNATYRNNTA